MDVTGSNKAVEVVIGCKLETFGLIRTMIGCCMVAQAHETDLSRCILVHYAMTPTIFYIVIAICLIQVAFGRNLIARYKEKKAEKKLGKIMFKSENEARGDANQDHFFHPSHMNGYRVATYNVEKMKELDEVIATVFQIDADVIVLQEIQKAHIPKMSSLLNEYPYHHTCFARRLNGQIGNMILSKFKLEGKSSGNLYEKMGILTRCFVVATFYHPSSRRGIAILGTHLRFGHAEKDDTKRKQQLTKIWYAAAKFSEHDVILAGDFNMDTASLKVKNFVDVFTKAETTSEAPEKTQWRGKRIDFIYVKSNMPVIKAFTFFSGASDHLPQVADLKAPIAQGLAPAN